MAGDKVSDFHETSTGLNDRVRINNRMYTSSQAYGCAKTGKVEGYNGSISSKGTKYIRSNPDSSKNNNLEKRGFLTENGTAHILSACSSVFCCLFFQLKVYRDIQCCQREQPDHK